MASILLKEEKIIYYLKGIINVELIIAEFIIANLPPKRKKKLILQNAATFRIVSFI